jgi:hypothetical protein
MQHPVLMAESAAFSLVADGYAKAFWGLAADWTITFLGEKPTGHCGPALHLHRTDIFIG